MALPATLRARYYRAVAYESPLDDPRIAAHAWARYRRLMRLMGLVTVVTIVLTLGVVYEQVGMVSINLYIAFALGIAGTMLLMGALMGLMFLSDGTGHDAAIEDPLREESDQA